MKKYLIAAVAAVAVFALSAFAASLQVDAGTLQAGDGSIVPCAETDVVVTYGTPTFTGTGWTVDTIHLDDGGQCTGREFSVTITGPATVTSVETGTFGASTVVVTFDAPFDAADAADVHLAIRSA